MKKFISPIPKTEEVKTLEQEQELVEEQRVKEKNRLSSASKQEEWGFTEKGNLSEEELSQEEKYIISGKSDIMISLDERFAEPIEKREKTYEFRKYRLNEETERMWIYVRQPVAKLIYIAEIEKAVEYPNQISEEGLGNKDFNQGLKVSKFAYKINHLYKLVNPVDSKHIKE